MLTSGRCWLKRNITGAYYEQKASNNQFLISKHHFYEVKAPQDDRITPLKAP